MHDALIMNAPWSAMVAEAIEQQPPDARDEILDAIVRQGGLEFDLVGDDRIVFKAGGVAFLSVLMETRPMAPMSSLTQ